MRQMWLIIILVVVCPAQCKHNSRLSELLNSRDTPLAATEILLWLIRYRAGVEL